MNATLFGGPYDGMEVEVAVPNPETIYAPPLLANRKPDLYLLQRTEEVDKRPVARYEWERLQSA